MKTIELSDEHVELARMLASDAVLQARQRVKECEQDGLDNALVYRKAELVEREAFLAKLEEVRGD